MTKERYERFWDLFTSLNVCCDELSLLASEEDNGDGELSDILDAMCADLDLIVSELKQRLKFIEF